MKKVRSKIRNAVGRLAEWGRQPSPSLTLVVGSTCGCEMARLERDVCAHLNRRLSHREGTFAAFDCEDIRCFAGHEETREFILDAASGSPDAAQASNDYELVLRGLATLGGVVLGGQAALDATRNHDNVFQVVLSRDGKFDADRLTTCLNPDRCGPECMVAMIADSFFDWMTAPERGDAGQRPRLKVPAFHIEEAREEDSRKAVAAVAGSSSRRPSSMLSRTWR